MYGVWLFVFSLLVCRMFVEGSRERFVRCIRSRVARECLLPLLRRGQRDGGRAVAYGLSVVFGLCSVWNVFLVSEGMVKEDGCLEGLYERVLGLLWKAWSFLVTAEGSWGYEFDLFAGAERVCLEGRSKVDAWHGMLQRSGVLSADFMELPFEGLLCLVVEKLLPPSSVSDRDFSQALNRGIVGEGFGSVFVVEAGVSDVCLMVLGSGVVGDMAGDVQLGVKWTGRLGAMSLVKGCEGCVRCSCGDAQEALWISYRLRVSKQKGFSAGWLSMGLG